MSDNASNSTPPQAASAPAQTAPQAQSIWWWVWRFAPIVLFFVAGLFLIGLIGLAQRVGWIQAGTLSTASSSEAAGEKTYTCPMHPQIRQNEPGRCPICGMKLEEVGTTGADLDKFAVTIQPAQRRLANIKTAKVLQQSVATTIQTVGAIEIDESRQATIASYIDGRVERIFADYTGVDVRQGDHLAVVYSPELYSAQVEYVEARRTVEKMSGAALAAVREAQRKLVTNSRHRLVELGMTDEQLKQLENSSKPESRLTIYSPIGGTVIQKLAEEGKYIKAGEPIYRIANLSTVWLMLELYPEDASRIRFGQVVKAELTSLPGEELIGRVAFVDPTVDKANRTVGVRVEFRNDDGRLRPGDYAHASIAIPIGPQGTVYDKQLAGKWISPMHPQVIQDAPGDCPICGMKLVPTSRYGYADQPVPQPQSVVVPRSALLMAGEHTVVYVETEPGRFELRPVTLGPILTEQAVILAGLEPGESVATSGNFLIDSQMQLAGKPSLIDPTRFKPQTVRNTPLEFDDIQITKIAGSTGAQLEELYQAYFAIQKAFSDDKSPDEKSVTTLSQHAESLAQDESLDETARQLLTQIKDNSAHLHHLAIDKARQQFKPISHAVVTLATTIRGDQAKRPFVHFFCPMVKQGEGDWLQPNDQLRNPYYGSEMLGCGELVRTIPPDTPTEPKPQTDSNTAPQREGDK